MKLLAAIIASLGLVSVSVSASAPAEVVSPDPGRFIVPKDLADGLYFVTPKATGAGARTGSGEGDFKLVAAYGTPEFSGKAIAEPVDNPGEHAARSYPPLAKRFPGRVEMGLLSQAELPRNDVLEAQRAMNAWCDAGNKVAPHSCAVWKVRGAFTQVDNRGDWNPCKSSEWNETTTLWNAQGWAWKPAYIFIFDWAKGYAQKFDGSRAC